MKTGSLVMYTGQCCPPALLALAHLGYHEPKRDEVYEVLSTWKGKFSDAYKLAIIIEGYEKIGFSADMFTEVQEPNAIDIGALLEETNLISL